MLYHTYFIKGLQKLRAGVLVPLGQLRSIYFGLICIVLSMFKFVHVMLKMK